MAYDGQVERLVARLLFDQVKVTEDFVDDEIVDAAAGIVWVMARTVT